ncbi:globin [Micromonospora matsumotoense]|nr:globin [Micromonospora matsumotoense]
MVIRWLRLVAADAELAPYLIGLDRPRLAGRLTAQLATALGGPGSGVGPGSGGGMGSGGGGRAAGGAWRRLGLTDEQHWRVLDYLAAVLCGLGLPVDTIVAAQRAVAGEARA